MSDKATPTRWTIGPVTYRTEGAMAYFFPIRKHGDIDCIDIALVRRDNPNALEHAKRIVRAANCHEALVAACNQLIDVNTMLIRFAKLRNEGNCPLCEGFWLLEDFEHGSLCPVALARAALVLAGDAP